MAEDPPTKPARPARKPEEGLPVGSVEAPFIYFDACTGVGNLDGVVRLTLAAVRNVPIGGIRARNEFVVTGYLRCSTGAARRLRDALDKALLIGAKTEGQAN